MEVLVVSDNNQNNKPKLSRKVAINLYIERDLRTFAREKELNCSKELEDILRRKKWKSKHTR